MRRLSAAAARLIRQRLLPLPRAGSRPGAIAALALAVVAAALAGPATDPGGPLRRDVAALVDSYGTASGLIGTSWWQAAVALSTVETYAQTTGDTSFDSLIARTFAHYSSGNFENGADDDTAWWGLAWLQAYDLTHVRAYLSMAETDADYIHQDWDAACGGGVWWTRSPRSYKNAISNELFLELTAWLHNTIRGDTRYLGWAEAEWSWFEQSGMINNDSLVNDGLTNNCQNNGQPTWTYNQGVILAGLAQLYRATGNRDLLAEAEHIATAAISHLTVGGVLTEACVSAACAVLLDADSQSFKGIFVQDLKILAVTAKTRRFNAFFTRQAHAIAAHDTAAGHRHGMSWTGPVTDVTSFTQDSAVNALVAAVKLPGE
jgi:predicted alpha-1,6-mannanase (GH76 family)